MRTLLTTDRMNPALRARIEKAVRGNEPSCSRVTHRGLALLRFFAVGGAIAAVAWAVVSDRRATAELEAAREQLLQKVSVHSEELKDSHRRILLTVQRHLFRASGKYAGDHIVPEVSEVGFDSILKRPSVYIRAELGAFDSLEGTKSAVSRSEADAFLACLLNPLPSSASEKEILKVIYHPERVQRSGGGTVLRLQDAVATLELLSPAWLAGIQRAGSWSKITELSQIFERAPIEAGVRAAKAELLVYALDEDKEPSTDTSFDGGATHSMRVGLIDLNSGKELLRARRRVDLGSVSEANRLNFGGGITSCRVALELHAHIATRRGVGPAGR